jgi:hypothetical protein
MNFINRFVAALVLAALACDCGMQSRASSTPTAGATTTAAPTSTISAGPSEASSPTPAVALVSFEPVFRVEAAELYAITDVHGGFLAGGCRLSLDFVCEGALLVRSPDGHSWSEVALPDADGRRIIEVAETPFGMIALGRTEGAEPPLSRAAWHSSDGERWEPFTIDAPASIVFESVVVLPDRTVLLGADYAFDFTVSNIAWATVDGNAWTSGTTPISAKVAVGPGLVAVGNECVDVCDPGSVNHVYRSSDGFEWTEETIPADLAAAQIDSLGVRAGRAVVGGTLFAPSGGAALLWHREPSGWRQTQLPGGIGYSFPKVLVIGDRELVVARSGVDGQPTGWWSADAMRYAPVRVLELRAHYVTDVAGEDPLVLLIDFKEIWIATF